MDFLSSQSKNKCLFYCFIISSWDSSLVEIKLSKISFINLYTWALINDLIFGYFSEDKV